MAASSERRCLELSEVSLGAQDTLIMGLADVAPGFWESRASGASGDPSDLDWHRTPEFREGSVVGNDCRVKRS